MRHFNYASQSTRDNLNGLPLFKKQERETREDILTECGSHTWPDDICERKHGGNPESCAAFDAIKDKLTAKQQMVLSCIRVWGDYGATVDELAVAMERTPNEISGRCSELLRDGKIKRDGRRQTRSGCYASVLKAI